MIRNLTPQQAVAWLRSLPPHHWNFQITGPQIADLIERLVRERDDLGVWKQSAMQVMNGIDIQSVGREIGVPLGEDIGPNILPAIREMKQHLQKARAQHD